MVNNSSTEDSTSPFSSEETPTLTPMMRTASVTSFPLDHTSNCKGKKKTIDCVVIGNDRPKARLMVEHIEREGKENGETSEKI